MSVGVQSCQNNEIPTTHDAQAILSTLCISHESSAVCCYSVIISSFIMAHISQQLYSLQNHQSKMGNNDMLPLFCCDLVGLGAQIIYPAVGDGWRHASGCFEKLNLGDSVC